MNERFWTWVEQELNRRGLSYYRVEQDTGLSNAAISRPARQWSTPSLTVCKALAQAFELPTEIVLQRAGHLPTSRNDGDLDARLQQRADEIFAIWEHINTIDPEMADRLLAIVRLQADAMWAAVRAGADTLEEDTSVAEHLRHNEV